MELFSEIYNCYYQVLRHLLSNQAPVTIQDIRTGISNEGFEESMLAIIPKIENGSWNLFEKEGELYYSKLSDTFAVPFSNLQKSYLKALLSDKRIRLFLTDGQIENLNEILSTVTPLWSNEQFCLYDRFADGDPYDDDNYRKHFRMLLHAHRKNRYVDIDYTSPKGTRVHHYYFPARIEYSVKNDMFRLLALEQTKSGKMKLHTLNLNRIQSIQPTNQTMDSAIDLDAIIRASYYKEPLKLRIIDERNALERTMLHFANYEKNTTKIDEDTYECLIYYNQSMETELLIEVMSFGPMLTVLGNEHFLDSLKKRLERQIKIK